MKNILKINSSVRYTDSVSRQLTDKLVQKICNDADTVVERDLNSNMYFITEHSLEAVSKQAHERSQAQIKLASVPMALWGRMEPEKIQAAHKEIDLLLVD